MGQPFIQKDRRPTLVLIKRTGTFADGTTSKDVLGDFNIDIEFRKSSEVSAVIDNHNGALSALNAGDYLQVKLQNDASVVSTLFYGPIHNVSFDALNRMIKVKALDFAIIGKSRDVNQAFYQKFNNMVEVQVNVTNVNQYDVDLPAGVLEEAPITLQSRKAVGNHLRAQFDNPNLHRWDAVYSSPFASSSNRGLGGDIDLDVDPIPPQPYGSSDGAVKMSAQVFTIDKATTITNLMIPITVVRHVYQGQTVPSNFSPGVTSAIGNNMYALRNTGTPVAGINQLPTDLSSAAQLKISLVRCVKADQGLGTTTYTNGGLTVKNKAIIPTSLNAFAEWDNATGTDWGSKNAGFADFPVTDILYHDDGTKAEVYVNAANPIQAPNGPVGETIARSYDWRQMYGTDGAAAFTMFEWNFDHKPIHVERGDRVAIICEMTYTNTGTSVQPDGTVNNAAGGTNLAYFGIGVTKYQATTTKFPRYPDGDLMIAARSDSAGSLVGTHGEAKFSLLAHTPNYNGRNAAYGQWEYHANINPNLISMESYNASVGTAIDFIDMELFDKRYDIFDSYFTVMTGGFQTLVNNAHYKVDFTAEKIRFENIATSFTPIDVSFLATKLLRLSYYTNPSTGGLLDPSNKSSVSDMVKTIAGLVSEWSNIIVSENGDYIDDVEGVGYNNPTTNEMGYYSAVQTNVWDAVSDIAARKGAQVWINHDGTNSTLVFEKKTTLSDFTYTAPGNHQYTLSTRKQDPNWMKLVKSFVVEKDFSNMYSRIKVNGRSNPEATYGYNSFTAEYTQLPSTEPQPITYILDIPEMESEIGFRREYAFSNNRGVTTYKDAQEVALALKEIYGYTQFVGSVTVHGLFPLIATSEFGAIIDRNAVVRLIDENNPVTASVSGTTNVFRVTGISYDAGSHETKVKFTRRIENNTFLDALKRIDEAKTNNALENTGRHHSAYGVDSVAQSVYTSDVKVALFDSDGVELTDVGYQRVRPVILDNSNLNVFNVIATFEPGIGIISDDAKPIKFARVFHSGGNSSLITLDKLVRKWTLDSLIVNLDILRS